MPKLNKENWNKFQMEVVLTAKDLFEYVDGTKEAPTEGAPLSTWKKADARAQEVLVTRMEPIPLTHIMNCTSHEMWKKLQSVYERESNVSVHLLYQQFYSLKFEDNMNTYLTAVNNLVATLKQRGEELYQENGNDQIHYDSPRCL